MKNLRKKNIQIGKRSASTPLFMPDATRGLVKLTTGEELKTAGVKAVVVNTLHLFLNPGTGVIKRVDKAKRNYKKGIHKFMNWDGLVLSDSGGFQVFSLIHKNPRNGKIGEDKVVFKSPWDGSRQELSPEKSIQIQFDLGVDMMVCLDDCPPNEFSREKMKSSIERTLRWARRCRQEYDKQVKKRNIPGEEKPLLFSVIQGGPYVDLRKYCAEELVKIGFDGYGFGARPVDKEGNFLEEALRATAGFIPENSWRFGLGIGLPEDILRCAYMGWDLFDCVIPTREGRHGKLFSFKKRNKKLPQSKNFNNFYEVFNINNQRFKTDFSPINKKSQIPELRNYSRSYLQHLFKIKEPLGPKLASLNNLEFYSLLLDIIRQKK